VSDTEHLQKIEGVWYRVNMMEPGLPQFAGGGDGKPAAWVYPQHWDVLKKKMVSLPRHANFEQARPNPQLVRQHRYAAAKQQLSSAGLKHHQLSNDVNDNAGNSRRFFWKGAARDPALALSSAAMNALRAPAAAN
jgi:hypothetical protein